MLACGSDRTRSAGPVRTFCPVVPTILALCLANLAAADPIDLIAEASGLFRGQSTAAEDLVRIREILDRIVEDYPASDIALRVALEQRIGTLDVAMVNGMIVAHDLPAAVDDPVAARLAEAQLLLDQTAEAPPDQRGAALDQALALLDSIIVDFPGSDAALQLSLGVAVEGIDLAALRDERDAIADVPQTEDFTPMPAGLDQGSVIQPLPPPVPPGDATTEAALTLDRQDWRDLQARLFVLGYDPNGIDGQPGPGTRGAMAAWQQAQSLPATGYLDAAQRDLLVAGSQAALDVWLAEPGNRDLHTPPPPIALTARNVSGIWTFTASCGDNSRMPGQTVSGVLDIAYDGAGSIEGRVQNSQGLIGQVSGTLSGRTVRGVIRWGLLFGSVAFEGRIGERALSLRGSDSNGCGLRADHQ